MKPQPICFLTHQQTGNDLGGNVYITVRNDIFTCTYIQKLNNLIPRDEQLTITIAPAVCEVEKYEQKKASAIGITNTSAVVNLRLPTVKPINCPSVGVKAGDTVSCTCYLDDPGYPPGQPRWYSNNTGVLSTGNDCSQVLTVQMTSQNPNPVYVCDVYTILQNNILSSSSNTFTPKTIFGPGALDMILTPSDSYYDDCPGSAGITINCTVPYNQINEFPYFTIMQDTETISTSHGQLSGIQFYGHQKTVYPKSYGKHTFSCLAENLIYPEIFQRKDQSIEIRAPLLTAPWIQTDKHPTRSGTFDAEVSVGEMIYVRCVVDGGVPNEYDIYLDCLSKSNLAKGNQVINRVEVTQETYGRSCVCGAKHVTGCYKLTSTMTFVKAVDTKMPLIVGLSCGGGVVLIAVVLVAIACWRYHSKKAHEFINKDLVGYDRPRAIGSNGNPYIVHTLLEEVSDEPPEYSAPDETPNPQDTEYNPTVGYPYPPNYPYSLSQNYPYPQNYSDGSFDPKNYDKFNGSITDFYRPFNPSDYSQSNYNQSNCNQSNYNQSTTSGRQASNESVPYTVAWGHRPLPPN
ncbi:uncharacterized protein LOC131939597 [Physella acuta]|uniref:uncharacterized protein LOC131939597 n=1 Tax=Physella acuta TaxID=109671 RepID=UPI0027DAE937|nr:uncharacterized protein LOC131939597 [Physella acuta]